MKKIAPLLNFVLLLTACSSLKDTAGSLYTEVDYEVHERNVMRDTVWKMYKSMEKGTQKRYRLKNIKAHQNPDPSSYTLKLNDSVSKLTFNRRMYKDDGKSLKSYSSPLGQKIIRFKDSTGFYTDFSEEIDGAYQKEPKEEITWKDGKKDSLIEGVKTHLMLGTNEDNEIRAWTTQKYPAALGIKNISYSEGFILAYEIKIHNPGKGVKLQTLKVYPTSIDQERGTIDIPQWTNEVTDKEIKEYYRKLNERNNG